MRPPLKERTMISKKEQRLAAEIRRLNRLVRLWRKDYYNVVEHASYLEKEVDWLAESAATMCNQIISCEDCRRFYEMGCCPEKAQSIWKIYAAEVAEEAD